MNLDRKAIEARKAKINQDDVDKFIDGADKPNEQKVTGRPRRMKGEKVKPVTISLTPTEERALDLQIKRFDMISFQKEELVKFNRGGFVRSLTQYVESLSDDEYFELIKSNTTN